MKKGFPFIFAIFAGLSYGMLLLFFGRLDGVSFLKDLVVLMSIGYIFILPFAIGFITVFCASDLCKNSWAYRIFMPVLVTALMMAMTLMLGWEGAICLIMGGVIQFPMAMLGGLISGILFSKASRRQYAVALLLVMTAPMSSSYIESSLDFAPRFELVETSIPIATSSEKIWPEIIRVRKITEPITGVFYKMGFPKPIEATLSHEGIGGVREARFDKNLVFIETITEWVDHEMLSFAIEADPAHTPLTTLDEHVTVGGEYFDVLQGTYRIEKINDTSSILHLSSRFRVSTHFNFYASVWARFLMQDIQTSILKVLQMRCEL